MITPWAVAALGGYLLGSVPVSDLVARRHGVDLRAVGDHNPGYWNAKEQLGARRALPVLLGDTAKGAVAGALGVAVAALVDAPWGVRWVAVGGAMVGHGWPLFAGFRGGKSLLAFVGGMLVVAPVPALIGVAVCTAVSLAHSFSTGIKVSVFSFPVVELAFDPPVRVAATGLLLCIIALRFVLAATGSARRRRRPPASGEPFPV